MKAMEKSQLVTFMNEKIPFNRSLGLQLIEASDGFAKMKLPFRDDFVGDPFRPAIHGGVISALIDTSGGAAVFSIIGDIGLCSTVDLRVDFLRPGDLEDLICEAQVVRIGNRVAVIDATVTQSSKKEPIATGKAVFNVRRNEDLT